VTSNPDSGSRVVGVPAGPGRREATAGGAVEPAAEQPAEASAELPLDEATAYGIEGFDPDDPWNAVLCVESDRAVTVLPLTPKSLGQLVGTLGEIHAAQRQALGVETEDDPLVPEEQERPRAFGQVAQAARLATGSAPVARLWQTSTRGRIIIIGGAVLFVVLGIVASVLTG
jgi:hypothetical protein